MRFDPSKLTMLIVDRVESPSKEFHRIENLLRGQIKRDLRSFGRPRHARDPRTLSAAQNLVIGRAVIISPPESCKRQARERYRRHQSAYPGAKMAHVNDTDTGRVIFLIFLARSITLGDGFLN
jgi:hypothetical protein